MITHTDELDQLFGQSRDFTSCSEPLLQVQSIEVQA